MTDGDRWLSDRHVLGALLAITALALVLRLVDLGGRIAHWDEARVAYWTLRYHALGEWEYHPVVHGPFLFHANELVFGLFGADDVTMRLVVALIAGGSPLAAWLLRDHLSAVEVLVVAGFLALNPVLLYYGRFSRNDLILGVMMLVAFGLLLRAHASGRTWYLYPAAVAVALGFAMKENALLYLLCWGGGIAVVVAHRLAYERASLRMGRPTTRWQLRHTWRERLPDAPRAWARDGLLAGVAGLTVLVVFYAPRGTERAGLGELVTAPWRLPAVLDASLGEGGRRLYTHWIDSGSREPFDPLSLDFYRMYGDLLSFYLDVLAAGAIVLVAFAAVGIVVEHRRVDGPRWVVVLAFVWGLLSVLGYPYAGTILAPWLVVHMVIPLAIPAAVGVGALVEVARTGHRRDDRVQVAIAGAILLVAVVFVIWPAYGLVYDDPAGHDNELVQFAQPGGEWTDTIDRMHDLVEANEEGVDVLFVGERFATDDRDGERYKQAGSGWYDRLPLPWYTEQMDAEVASVQTREEFEQVLEEERPPVIIVPTRELDPVVGLVWDYETRHQELRHGAFDIHIYLDLDRLDDA